MKPQAKALNNVKKPTLILQKKTKPSLILKEKPFKRPGKSYRTA